ncbi:hypothetical protein HERIO_771 [Hepatospora eriocheir]|uniref:Uncharacterized protein n=1 Tax=Hepatospora eriocheir TaxID=1081669 RepID=A0A1X0QC28_9MICR|nr:hypothetical protein HERIO_771 [Hepatospora eriocheir]
MRGSELNKQILSNNGYKLKQMFLLLTLFNLIMAVLYNRKRKVKLFVFLTILENLIFFCIYNSVKPVIGRENGAYRIEFIRDINSKGFVAFIRDILRYLYIMKVHCYFFNYGYIWLLGIIASGYYEFVYYPFYRSNHQNSKLKTKSVKNK